MDSIQEVGVSLFLGSAVLGAVIGVVVKRFNLIYLATHRVDALLIRNLTVDWSLKVDNTEGFIPFCESNCFISSI